MKIGVRHEDKIAWEKRAPITPRHIRELKEKGIEVVLQPSEKRIFLDKEYRHAGAELRRDISDIDVIFGLKEIPEHELEENKTYVFFSHTIKGQEHNMPMLKRMMELGCNLIDYETVTDGEGRRLIFFGRHAGLAGMIDTLWALGKRLEHEGLDTPLKSVKRAYEYHNIHEAKEHLGLIGEEIRTKGWPREIEPVVIGFAGYGHVSKGAQEILDGMSPVTVPPEEVANLWGEYEKGTLYKVVFKEEHTVEPESGDFDLQEFFANGSEYKSRFDRYIPYLSVLMNCIYWKPGNPRLVTKEYLRENYRAGFKLKVVGDISCDVHGAIECCEKGTEPDVPNYVWEPSTGRVIDGVEGQGPVIMAVYILPSELPRDSSEYFSDELTPFVEPIAYADYQGPLEDSGLPPEIKRATILWHGKLTPRYEYIEKYL